ncbi:dihydroxyacetone kinase subunit DhaK [Propylenella binzhouense]|uniref:Dihydroxyacetone kinase subunit DhaK n=1 Tax=Propylenella binzhouense TaxID=2555902 RepID=A0A964WSM5_9HYPH|nr:dihydroxyacetone kinase subunit DhaK [Propylenella binzhouense]MYZ47031.1 dihydroxyacetone kinase subunit DhaK [Propylenella binzhouense]
MKKLINAPGNYVDEMLDGLVAAHPYLARAGEEGRVIRRASAPRRGKVGIVSGGGSGHLPLFTGYVAEGMLDACAIGNVFEGPTVGSCVEAIQAADGGAGVLRLYGNYGGDRMNFDMAGEIAEADGIESTTVLGIDDVASAAPEEGAKRRGVAGILYAYKAAGAMADRGASLAEVTATAADAVARTRTIGVALSPCLIPGSGAPSFTLGENEIEMGMGIHGEPGIWRAPLRPADEVADEMLDRLTADAPLSGARQVSVLVNSLGATPLEELYILYRRIAQRLAADGLEVVMPLVGHYATSMEMAGVSVSLCVVDGAFMELLAAPTSCPFWRGAA